MGNACCNDGPKGKGEFSDQIVTKDKQQNKQPSDLTKSGLLISKDVNNIISRSGGLLSGTFIPGVRDNNSSLILGAGGANDPKKLVRFFLIATFYINKYNSKDADFENIFYELAKKTHPSAQEQGKLTTFKTAYDSQGNDLKKSLLVVNQVFTSKFIIENLSQILLGSDDPKDIGHLIFPLSRIFNGIKKNYHDSLRSKKHNPIYIIAELNKQEMELIGKMKGEECCFCFSVFMKGFTSESKARAQFNKIKKESKDSDRTAFFFTVNFKYKYDKMEAKYDYGFYVNPDESTKVEGDVLFNIMNTFKVADSYGAAQYDLEYGYLPYIYFAKYTDRTPNIDTSSLRVLQLCSAVSNNYLKSQSCLFRIIKEQENSLKVSRSIIEQTQHTHSPSSLLTEVQVENLINNYIDQERYDDALRLAEERQSSYLIKAKKLEILYKSKRYDQARKWAAEMGKDGNSSKISQGEEIVEFISAKLLQLQGKRDKAKEKLRQLQTRMITKYEENYQVIGGEVINMLEQLFGKAQDSPVDQNISKSQRQARKTIERSQLNLRGISTTI